MTRRIDLQKKFEDLLGNRHVYFQPPPGYMMEFPCIVYSLSTLKTRYFNDMPHTYQSEYDVTYISSKPDDDFVGKLAEAFPMIRIGQRMVSDNLYHTRYTLHY